MENNEIKIIIVLEWGKDQVLLDYNNYKYRFSRHSDEIEVFK